MHVILWHRDPSFNQVHMSFYYSFSGYCWINLFLQTIENFLFFLLTLSVIIQAYTVIFIITSSFESTQLIRFLFFLTVAAHSGPILAARTSIYLWEFLLEILEDPDCASIVRWTDKAKGEFEFLNVSEVARQWGIVKRRPNMDKIKMCRAMRYYYKKDIIQKVSVNIKP